MLGWAPAVTIVSTVSTLVIARTTSRVVIVAWLSSQPHNKMRRNKVQVSPLPPGTSNRSCVWKRFQRSVFFKKVLGRKRHPMADTGGRALVLQVHPASNQDRDGALPLLATPFVEICSIPTRMECDRSISGPPAPIGLTSLCPGPGRKPTVLARSGGRLACRQTVLGRPRAGRLFVCRQ